MVNNDDYRFERISVREGLSHSNVYCTLQDRQGFIWFGTSAGVSKYDGYKFINYYVNEDFLSPINQAILSCYEDSNGSIWFGSTAGILVEYDLKNDCLIKHEINITEKYPIRPSIIESICEDSFGFLWISTLGQGLYKFDRTNKIGSRVNYKNIEIEKSKDWIINIIITPDNKLLIGTRLDGIDIFNLDNGTSENISIEDIFPNSHLIFIHRKSHNEYFFGSNKGIGILHLDSKEVFHFENTFISTYDISSIFIDKEENYWLGIANGGLIKVENKKNSKANSSDTRYIQNFGNDRIQSMLIDRSNVMWIGTQGSGIYKLDIIRKQFHFISKFHNEKKDLHVISDLKIDTENNLWVSTFLNNLYKYDLIKNEFTHYNTLDISGNVVNPPITKRIFEDIEKNLWLGSNGLHKYIKAKDAFIEVDNSRKKGLEKIFTISEYFQDSKHFILIGSTKPGVVCIDTKTGTICDFDYLHALEPKIKINYIDLLYFDNDKNLWIKFLTQKDIFRFSNSKSVIEENPMDFKDNEIVLYMYEDSFNNLWFCTTNGLIKYMKDIDTIHRFNISNGLPTNRVHGIIEDKNNNFWVTTFYGISKFDQKNNLFKNYDYTNGFINENFGTCCKDKNGTLYFGGSNGIDYFNPDELLDNPFVPKIVITDFQLFNKSISPAIQNSVLTKSINCTEEINLSYNENIFSFEFAALIFNNSIQNEYAYMMEGFEKDWVYCGTRRTATYTNLDPGEYVFRVKGSNNDGVWNEEGTSIKITISPPYWKTWWFKGLGALSLLAAAGYSYNQKLEKLKNESKIQKDFSRKLIETQENEKKRIAHELHDTIAHDVLISKNKALMALKHDEDNKKMKEALKEISELSSTTITDVRNIAYNLHPHQLERLGLTKTIKSIINEVNSSTTINFIFETDDVDELLSKESEINLFRVIQESISNIIKHSKATEVILKVSKLSDQLSILIVDNGKGFDLESKAFEEAKHGFGLSGIAERIRFMNGEIKIDSELNKGTTLKFLIPIKS